MKVMSVTFKILFFVFLILSIAVFSAVGYLQYTLTDDYKINRGETLEINSIIPITAEYDGALASRSVLTRKVGESFEVNLKMFGVIPFSTVNVEVVDEMYVAVLGNPFGMKLYTDGVLVIDLTDVDTSDGNVNPAKDADIRIGDYICTANGVKISCNEDISDIVSDSAGKSIELEILRNGKYLKRIVTPQLSVETSSYRIGVWVRDSTAGIGTLTFYSPSNDTICGLGHGICDEDTGSLLTVETGEMVGARIISINKGSNGSPGELKGNFTNEALADIELNTDKGVYGMLNGKIDVSVMTEVALKQEVTDGEAQILCTVDGEKPKLYSCTVKKRGSNYHSDTHNLTVTVTDPELLEKTGGIVQGMSGSPLLQNGKLVGAVTHVLVDDPTKGYAIFAENMLETAQSVAENIKLKDAS